MIRVESSEISKYKSKKLKERTQAVYPTSSHNLRVIQSLCTSKGFLIWPNLITTAQEHKQEASFAHTHKCKTSLLKHTSLRLPCSSLQAEYFLSLAHELNTSNVQALKQDTSDSITKCLRDLDNKSHLIYNKRCKQNTTLKDSNL